MAKRQQEVREPTKKQAAWTRRDRERRRWILIGLGIVLGAVVVILGIGIFQQLILEPNSPVATVNGTGIITNAYQARVKYERNLEENQLIQYQQLEQQFDPEGTSGFFTSQIGVKDLGYAGNSPTRWDGVPQDVLDQYGLKYDEKTLGESVKFDQT